MEVIYCDYYKWVYDPEEKGWVRVITENRDKPNKSRFLGKMEDQIRNGKQGSYHDNG